MGRDREIRTSAWGVVQLRNATQEKRAPVPGGGSVIDEKWSQTDWDAANEAQDALAAVPAGGTLSVYRRALRDVRQSERAHDAWRARLVKKFSDAADDVARAAAEDELVDLDESWRETLRTHETYLGNGCVVVVDKDTCDWLRKRVEALPLGATLSTARKALVEAIVAAKEPKADEGTKE